MKKKALVAAGALGVIVTLVMISGPGEPPPAGEGSPRPGETATGGGPIPEDADGTSLPAAPPPASARPVASPKAVYRSGTVLRADAQPAGGLVYWVWSGRLPAWAELHPGILELASTPRLPAPAGITDRRGTWAVDADLADPQAITFAVDGGLLVSFEPTRRELILPETGGIQAMLHGAEPDAGWTVSLALDASPAAGGASWTVVTKSGVAVVCELRREVPLEAAETFRAEVLADEAYALSARAEELRIAPGPRTVTAPAAVAYAVVHRFPALTLEVVDRPGGPPADVGGWLAVSWPPHHDEGEIREGRGALVRDLLPGDCRVRVLVEDGETFESSFSVPEDWNGVDLEFVRGRGARPLEIRLPGPAAAEVARMRIGRGGGSGRWWFAADRNGARAPGRFVRKGSNTILASEPPERWSELWVLTRSGRVAHANRTEQPIEVTAWLPDRPLPPVRLEDLHEENGQPRAGRIRYLLVLFPDLEPPPRIAALDTFEFDPTTAQWPIWSKREPIGMEGHFSVGRPLRSEDAEPAAWVRRARGR